jgi:hypothetical protein
MSLRPKIPSQLSFLVAFHVCSFEITMVGANVGAQSPKANKLQWKRKSKVGDKREDTPRVTLEVALTFSPSQWGARACLFIVGAQGTYYNASITPPIEYMVRG